jgi:hypothetical protein
MNARLRVVVAAVIVAVVCALVVGGRKPSAETRAAPPPVAGAEHPAAVEATRRSEVTALPAPSTPPRAVVSQPAAPLPPVAPDAAASLALTLRDGDARSPPIAPREPDADDVPPTTNELADPVAYRRYEARRQARVYRAFEREASIALGDMQRDIERARAAGVASETIAEGEDKARKLAETLRRVQSGEIGAND